MARIAPCRLLEHVRARSRRPGRRWPPPAGRCCGPSRFSSSVSVRTRRARISSISVASHMSPGLSAATSGWSYRMIGDDRTVVGSSASPMSTGKVPSFVHELDRGPGELRRLERREERGVVGVQERVHADERAAHGLVARHVGLGPVGDVLDRHPQRGERVRARGCARTRRARRRRPASARAPPGRRRRAPRPRGRRERDRHLADAGAGEVEARDVEDVLDRLVPARPQLAVDVELGHRLEPVADRLLDGAGLHLEEAELGRRRWPRARTPATHSVCIDQCSEPSASQ